MKITLSKKQWEFVGKQAGWMKKAQDDGEVSVTGIIDSIRNNTNEYFGYGHFHTSNMADYTMMSSTMQDLVDVYGIDESQASEIVQALTHGDD
jgi:hypothetical protein